MKKDWHVVVFGILYMISFALIYSIGFAGLDHFFFVLFLFALYNVLSLISVLILLAIERYSEKTIPEYFYLTVSFLTIAYLLFEVKSDQELSGNYLYPLFKEDLSTMLLVVVISFVISYFGFKLIQKKSKKHAT